jgi:hypothetical protein
VGFVPALVLGGLVDLVDAIGLPRSIAGRVGVGLRAPRLRFYERLNRDLAAFDKVMATARQRPKSLDYHLTRAGRIERH